MRKAITSSPVESHSSGPRASPCSRRSRNAVRYSSYVEPGTPRCRSRAYSAQDGGCGSQLASVGPKPYDGASASHGIGTRQPSRLRSVCPLRSQVGSCRASSGSVVCSGSPSSSPW
ncbi:hypothetical protein GCM10023176_59920 [Micromonospora coerulea]|uniref:Uncharacterized protein n=1 Tax=Micromonospora coerulea TaxID=47856 RepID=A0ABP8T6N3_9ACTN